MRPGRSLESSHVESTFPEMDTSSAVFPTVREVDGSLCLAYYLPESNDSAVILFSDCREWSYGGPNDESLARRNVWGLNLTFYSFHIVLPAPDESRTEWLATFHDGCFRVQAVDFKVLSEREKGCSPSEALNSVLGVGDNIVLDQSRTE